MISPRRLIVEASTYAVDCGPFWGTADVAASNGVMVVDQYT
jgi:hypothetical protein